LNQLTISAWVRPNYTNGSTELAVVGKENSFLLSINNIIPPKKTAKFSVFNGITWSSVESYTQVPQDALTHLVGVVDGTKVLLYKDGVLESSTELDEVFAISGGKINLVSADVVGSESDVVIGAYVETKRGEYKITKRFSGEIDKVTIYKTALTEDEIYEMFSGSSAVTEESKADESASISSATFNFRVDNRTKFSGYSGKIDRLLLEIITNKDPHSAATRMGTFYHDGT